MTTVAVMGSTGSIGTQTLEVIAAEPDRFEVSALGAASSVELLADQARAVRPEVVALADEAGYAELVERVPAGTEVVCGPDALADACGGADVVVNGVVGFGRPGCHSRCSALGAAAGSGQQGVIDRRRAGSEG